MPEGQPSGSGLDGAIPVDVFEAYESMVIVSRSILMAVIEEWMSGRLERGLSLPHHLRAPRRSEQGYRGPAHLFSMELCLAAGRFSKFPSSATWSKKRPRMHIAFSPEKFIRGPPKHNMKDWVALMIPDVRSTSGFVLGIHCAIEKSNAPLPQ